MGRELIERLDLINPESPDANFNLNSADFQRGWPRERTEDDKLNTRWLHGDARTIAYVFNHTLFEKWIQLGNLNSP
jgi:hypothetical protein